MTEATSPKAAVDQVQITARGGGVRLSVRVKPRASRSGLVGVREGALEVALGAPPVEGAANAELLRVLARVLDVRRTALRIATGARSRLKTVDVDGLDVERTRAMLSQALGR